jgi:hypothetical protein
MYKYILQTAGNINWMAVFALMTFFFVFLMSVYLAFVKDAKSLQHIADLPLSDDAPIIQD